ncbi:hypothetical protein DL770_002487 [Monosporascus sp. CRB-9-2]|nr:hypothetical protein DL770_002487 [Monosporascus sp. CRB-9-2]
MYRLPVDKYDDISLPKRNRPSCGQSEERRIASSGIPSHLSQESTPPCSLGTTEFENEAPSGYSTPLFSVPSEEVMDPDLLPEEIGLNSKTMDHTTANDPLEPTAALHESQSTSHESFPAVTKGDETRSTNPTDINVSFHQTPADLVTGITDVETVAETIANKNLMFGFISQDQDDAHHEKPLSLDQEGTEFEVEKLVAKGRIGSWVKKKDIGTGSYSQLRGKAPSKPR